MRRTGVEAVLITGGLGAGKTAVAAALGDLLEAQGSPGCVIDLDWLCWAWAPGLDSAGIHRLLCDNVRSVTPRLLAEGLSRVVLCRGILDPQQLDEVRAALGVPLRTVRLTAAVEQVQKRLRARDTGATLSRHLADLSAFAVAAERAVPDAPVLDTTGRTPEDVAAEILSLLEWSA